MPTTITTKNRNQLGDAYQAAEDLYDTARNLALLLEVYSARPEIGSFSTESLEYIQTNIAQAATNLQALQEHLTRLGVLPAETTS